MSAADGPSTVAPVGGFGIVDAILTDPAGLAALCALAFLIVSGFWAEWRFRRFARLPFTYVRLNHPVWTVPRSFAIWLPLVLFIAFLIWHVMSIPMMYLEPDAPYPGWGVVVASCGIVCLQIFGSWLHLRWARLQG